MVAAATARPKRRRESMTEEAFMRNVREASWFVRLEERENGARGGGLDAGRCGEIRKTKAGEAGRAWEEAMHADRR